MGSIIMYIGSEYVVKHPKLDHDLHTVRFETEQSSAAKVACRRFHTGILNSYRLDTSELTIAHGGNDEMSFMTDADVEIYSNSESTHIKVNSEKALSKISFLGASFVSMPNQ